MSNKKGAKRRNDMGKIKHKILSVFLIVFMVLALFGTAHAEVYRKTGIAGNASSDMDSIDGATLNDGDECRVFLTGNLFLWYLLDADSGATADDLVIVDPNDNEGSKRWILQDSGVSYEVTIDPNDTTPDVTYGTIFKTSANGHATAITDLDNAKKGQTYTIIGGSATNSSTIADGGKFNLSAGWTAGVDDVLILYCQDANDYIQVGVVDN